LQYDWEQRALTGASRIVSSLRLGLSPGSRFALLAAGCELIRLPRFQDPRGVLSPLEFEQLPFTPVRTFLVWGVPPNTPRGYHAHRECKQLLIAAHDIVTAIIDDGHTRQEVDLDDPSIALLLPPLVWGGQQFGMDAVLLVLASHPYQANDYIDNYATFQSVAAAARASVR
jgi:hypothetical protein